MIRSLCLIFGLAFAVSSAAQDSPVVVSDGDVTLTEAEFAAILATASESRLRAAAGDVGERYELINSVMRNRKLAAGADTLSPDDPQYWELQFKLQGVKEKFMFQRELDIVEVPNPLNLAREYYETKKDEYALRPEKRTSSHILLASPPGLDRTEVRLKAQGILDELRGGADWNAMVATHSADKGSAKRNGALDRSITYGDPSITPPYSQALFEIEAIGGYSEITDSQFGIHIVRLDGIEESGYYPYEEVLPAIMKDIQSELRSLASKEIRARYHLSEDAFIDGPAMEAFFEPYK